MMRRYSYLGLTLSSIVWLSAAQALSLPVVKLSPEPISIPLEAEKNVILYSNLKPFLRDVMVLSPVAWKQAPKIIGIETGLSLAFEGLGLRVADRSIMPGKYKVVGEPRDLKLPEKPGRKYWTWKKQKSTLLGVQVTVLGDVLVTDEGGRRRVQVMHTQGPVRKGDWLVPAEDNPPTPASIEPKRPTKVRPGVVIASMDNALYSGQYQTVAITGGKDKHRRVGDILNVYRHNEEEPEHPLPDYSDAELSYEEEASLKRTTPPPPGPDTLAGELMVVRVHETVSYALVLRSVVAIEQNNKVY